MQKLEVSEFRTTLFILTNKSNIIIFFDEKWQFLKKLRNALKKPEKNKKQLLKMGFSNLRDSGICAMNNFEFWRQISLLLFVVCF